MKPQVVAQGSLSQQQLENIKSQYQITREVDIFETQLKELFRIHHPDIQHDSAALDAYVVDRRSDDSSVWMYYPWSGSLLHCVGEDDLFELRTNRNRNIITEKEQNKLREGVVGVAGMSVGSGVALSLAYTGIAQTIKIADLDIIDTSNLNRLRESLLAVGSRKTELAARHIYEIDPFAEVIEFSDGVTDDNIEKFFTEPDLDIVIDEIDDFKMKVRLRLHAKKLGVPLLMFTSLGDSILVDVERYDIDRDLPIFNGQLGGVPEDVLASTEIGLEEIKKYSVKLVGQEFIPTRALQSVSEMGKTLVGRPQLYGTIQIDGGLAAYVVRGILLADGIPSGRYFINFAELFGIEDPELADTPERSEILARLFAHG